MTIEAAPAQPFRHTGTFLNVLGLACKNAAFTLVTLTLYRFWARTAMRRRLWSRVWVMGDALEYTGTAWELFRGFLIALPCFFLPAIFVFYIAPFAVDPTLAAWLLVGFNILAVPLIAAGRYLMRRYQLSRTRWRGIRFGLAGSAAGFAAASWGWTMLQGLTLGWYTPAARMNRARLLWENARFGDQPFEFVSDFDSPQQGLWWPFALGWFSLPVSVVLASFAAVPLVGALMPESADALDPTYNIIVTAFVAAITLLLLLFFWAPYSAASMNRIASLIALDGARFKLRAKTFSLFFVTLAGWIITIGSVGLLAPVAGFLQVRYVINRLEVIGTPRFADIGQPIVEGPRAGESLGEAFDLDVGVGVI